MPVYDLKCQKCQTILEGAVLTRYVGSDEKAFEMDFDCESCGSNSWRRRGPELVACNASQWGFAAHGNDMDSRDLSAVCSDIGWDVHPDGTPKRGRG